MLYVHRFSQFLNRKEPWRWLLTVTFAAFVGVAAGRTVIGSIGSIFVVDGVSMEPTFKSGARVYSAPISGPLARGDVVLLDDGNKDFAVKRIVGMPGETVQLWRGCVFIDRKLLREPYLARHTYTFPDERNETINFQLDDDQYFLLGDNRLGSADSRFYGPVARKQIKTRVPLPDDAPLARFANYTLPAAGKRTIRSTQ